MWEYLVRQVDVRGDMEVEAEAWLGQRGREGWELVTITFVGPIIGSSAGFRAAMKRPLKAEPRAARLLN